ncbi:MAG: carbon-nitrogen hydrolase family protein [Acidobacteria bacterium]|nr:carbon-nitrogen hydrolase family protein [Acidobacteriota bacterium]
MSRFPEFTMAIVQAAPALFDAEASADKASQLIEQAAEKGATIVAFGETWLPGYPFFAWAPQTSPGWWQAAAEYIDSAVEIPGPVTDKICAAARRTGVDVVIGVSERSKQSRATVYCTLLFVGREGTILGQHRKLKPTHAERTVWGEGEARSLRVYERPYGRVSGLACWEHNMVLPGYALMAQGTQIHVAAWPGTPEGAPPAPVPLWPRQLLLSRAFASQGACYVISSSMVITSEIVPERYRNLLVRERTGESYIIDPRGEVIAGPAKGETILTATGSLENVLAAKTACDVGGHYARPDQLRLLMDGRPLEHVVRGSSTDREALETGTIAEPEGLPVVEAGSDGARDIERATTGSARPKQKRT